MVLSVPIRFRGRKRALAPSVQIIGVSVINLFGRLTYSQIPTRLSDESNGRIAVLYGDNGTGKTTILRLIYACLSPETGSGLRDYIARVFFEKFSIYLSNGISLVVEKIDSAGSYTITQQVAVVAQHGRAMVAAEGRVLLEPAHRAARHRDRRPHAGGDRRRRDGRRRRLGATGLRPWAARRRRSRWRPACPNLRPQGKSPPGGASPSPGSTGEGGRRSRSDEGGAGRASASMTARIVSLSPDCPHPSRSASHLLPRRRRRESPAAPVDRSLSRRHDTTTQACFSS